MGIDKELLTLGGRSLLAPGRLVSALAVPAGGHLGGGGCDARSLATPPT